MRYRLACALFESGREADARAPFEELAARTRFEFAAEVQFRLGQCLANAGERVKAQACFQRALAAGKDYLRAPALALLAQAELADGDAAKALAHFEQLLERDAQSTFAADARSGRAWCLYRLGRLDAATAAVREALAAPLQASETGAHGENARAAELQFLLGECLLDQKQPREALAAYESVREGPYADAALRGAGFAKSALGDPRGAAAEFARVLERFPQSRHRAECALQRGIALFQAGDLAPAIAALSIAELEASPEALSWRARAELQAGDAAAALRSVRPARQARPRRGSAARLRTRGFRARAARRGRRRGRRATLERRDRPRRAPARALPAVGATHRSAARAGRGPVRRATLERRGRGLRRGRDRRTRRCAPRTRRDARGVGGLSRRGACARGTTLRRRRGARAARRRRSVGRETGLVRPRAAGGRGVVVHGRARERGRRRSRRRPRRVRACSRAFPARPARRRGGVARGAARERRRRRRGPLGARATRHARATRARVLRARRTALERGLVRRGVARLRGRAALQGRRRARAARQLRRRVVPLPSPQVRRGRGRARRTARRRAAHAARRRRGARARGVDRARAQGPRGGAAATLRLRVRAFLSGRWSAVAAQPVGDRRAARSRSAPRRTIAVSLRARATSGSRRCCARS